ncbi:MAG: Acetoin utilization protein AcuC [Candidatus Heimdallarchaeota archaeon LC_2]|nr:MAG: Acetoin utilization protein AcuC [Candidatus Heimdallarchaeota archaeon LC_2]
MNPQRLGPSISLLNYLYSDNPDFKIINPSIVDPSVIELAHTKEYISTLNEMSVPGFIPSHEGRLEALTKFNLGTGDCPIFENMAQISELIVGSTLSAAEGLMKNEFSKAFVLLAGLHHASQDRASGFCYYNDVNVTIRNLQNQNENIKILYLDTDLHAGDGVNYEFYNDPNVLTISFHESGEFIFPGTCFPDEIGSKEGTGYAINLPFYPYTSDDLYQKALFKYIPTFMDDFQPDIVIWQAGVDGHRDDPLGHLQLTTNSYVKFGEFVNQLSEKMETPRLLALGGGGYNPISVTRSWIFEVSGLANKPVPTKLPNEWRKECVELWGVDFPKHLMDEPSKVSLEIGNEQKHLYDVAIENFEKHVSPYWSIE